MVKNYAVSKGLTPATVMISVLLLAVTIGNFYLSRFASNKLVVRTIDDPQLIMSKPPVRKTPAKIQVLECDPIIAPMLSILPPSVHPKLAENHGSYCTFGTDTYVVRVFFPTHMTESVPTGYLNTINNGIAYTIINNHGYSVEKKSKFVHDTDQCTVMAIVSRPVLLSVTYEKSNSYVCGIAEHVTLALVNNYLLKHIS